MVEHAIIVYSYCHNYLVAYDHDDEQMKVFIMIIFHLKHIIPFTASAGFYKTLLTIKPYGKLKKKIYFRYWSHQAQCLLTWSLVLGREWILRGETLLASRDVWVMCEVPEGIFWRAGLKRDKFEVRILWGRGSLDVRDNFKSW